MVRKEQKGKGFDLYLDKENTSLPEKRKENRVMTKLHCEIEKELKKRVETFKVQSEKSIKEIVSEALREYLEKHAK